VGLNRGRRGPGEKKEGEKRKEILCLALEVVSLPLDTTLIRGKFKEGGKVELQSSWQFLIQQGRAKGVKKARFGAWHVFDAITEKSQRKREGEKKGGKRRRRTTCS